MLPEIEIAWLAGIFDGEGGARIYRGKSGKQTRYQAQVQAVSNTDPAILQRVQDDLDALGLKNKYHKRRDAGNTKQPNAKIWWKACGDIRLSGRSQIITFLELILPHTTGDKKAQAAHVLSFLKLQESNRDTREVPEGKRIPGGQRRPLELQRQEEQFFMTQTFARGIPQSLRSAN